MNPERIGEVMPAEYTRYVLIKNRSVKFKENTNR